MQIIEIKDGNFPLIDDDICCAIGNFDGVHLGHQKLIENTFNKGSKTAVLTFNPHPSSVLMKIKNYKQLTPLAHKIKIIESYNIDYLFLVEFNTKIANLEINEFIANLKKLGIKKIVCGYDFRFGKMASGSIIDLAKYFEVYEIPKFQVNNIRVSSTYIKELLSEGEVSEVEKILGRSYSIVGKVFKGKQIGRTIGYPTANISYDNYYLPKGGVYACRIKVDNNIYIGMCNIGYNPTVCYSTDVKVEVNIFGFNADIYDKEIEVIFDNRVRYEQKFSSLKELKDQLSKDKLEIYRFYEGGKEYETISSNHQ